MVSDLHSMKFDFVSFLTVYCPDLVIIGIFFSFHAMFGSMHGSCFLIHLM